MRIKTSDGEYNVASKGLAATGTALGGVALAGLLSSNGNGLLGGLFGGGNCQDEKSALMAALAKEKSERFAETVGISTFKEALELDKEQDLRIGNLEKFVANLDKENAVYTAVNTERIKCLTARVDKLEDLTKVVVPADNVCPHPITEGEVAALVRQIIKNSPK